MLACAHRVLTCGVYEGMRDAFLKAQTQQECEKLQLSQRAITQQLQPIETQVTKT
jgi:hypothetical protein